MRNSVTMILDVSSFQYRAFHAAKARPTYAKDGTPNYAVNLFRKMLENLQKEHPTQYRAAAMDSPTETWRVVLYPLYKATRHAPHEEYLAQLPGFRTVLREFFIPIYQADGYEADDVIGTLVHCISPDSDILIATGDKDMMQLITQDDRVRVLNTHKNRIFGYAAVAKEYGVPPDHIVDYLALVGDASDNIPGASGIGPKGAAELLQRFGTVEEVLARTDEIRNAGYRHSLQDNAENVRLSKRLATLDCHVPGVLQSFK